MDLLVALGTLITFAYSIYIIFVGGMTSFETICMLISFISFGEYIENRAKRQTNKVVEDLVNLAPESMTTISSIYSEEEIKSKFNSNKKLDLIDKSADEVLVGDYVFVGKGESIPVDGKIICGNTSIDESMLTGESDLLNKITGDKVTCGTKNINANIIVVVTSDKSNSTLAKIVQAVIDAQSSKAPVSRIADKIASVFVPVVLCISLITFIA